MNKLATGGGFAEAARVLRKSPLAPSVMASSLFGGLGGIYYGAKGGAERAKATGENVWYSSAKGALSRGAEGALVGGGIAAVGGSILNPSAARFTIEQLFGAFRKVKVASVGKVKSFTPQEISNIKTTYEKQQPSTEEEKQLRSLIGKKMTSRQLGRHAAIGVGAGLGVHFAQPLIGGGRRWTPWTGKKEVLDVIAGKDWPEESRQAAKDILKGVKDRPSVGRVGNFMKGGYVSKRTLSKLRTLLPVESPIRRILDQTGLEASRAVLHPRQLATAATIGTILGLAMPAAKQYADTRAAKKGKF